MKRQEQKHKIKNATSGRIPAHRCVPFQPFFKFNCNHKNDEEGWCHSGQFLKMFPHSFQFQMYPFFPFFVEVKTIFIDWFSMVYDLQIAGRFSSKNKEGKTLLWCSFSRHNEAKVFLESLGVLPFSFLTSSLLSRSCMFLFVFLFFNT